MEKESGGKPSAKDMLNSFPRKKAAVSLAVLVLAGAAIFVATNIDSIADTPELNNNTSELEQPANNQQEDEQESKQRVGLTPSKIPGEITDVTVDDERADPSEALIAPEDGIRFVNEAGLDLEFEFDRNIDTFQVSAGESIIINPESILYYTVNPVDENVEFREISARINVQ